MDIFFFFLNVSTARTVRFPRQTTVVARRESVGHKQVSVCGQNGRNGKYVKTFRSNLRLGNTV